MPQIRCVDLLGQYWPQDTGYFWESNVAEVRIAARVVPAQRQSDRKMGRAVRSLMCVFGMNCRRGLDCHCGHSDVEKKLFADRKAFREKEWMAPCGFCALGRV